jgi:tight adherence protein C
VGLPRPRRWLTSRSTTVLASMAVIAASLLAFPRPWVVVGAIAVWQAPKAYVRRRERRRLHRLAADLPEVIDLLRLTMAAGFTVAGAVPAVAARAEGPLADELRGVVGLVARGLPLGDALEAMPARAGERTRPLVAALVAADRYGAPLLPALERLAGDARDDRRRRAEAHARRVPVKLLFPLVGCILPAFGLLTLAPVIASALRTLRLGNP